MTGAEDRWDAPLGGGPGQTRPLIWQRRQGATPGTAYSHLVWPLASKQCWHRILRSKRERVCVCVRTLCIFKGEENGRGADEPEKEEG